MLNRGFDFKGCSDPGVIIVKSPSVPLFGVGGRYWGIDDLRRERLSHLNRTISHVCMRPLVVKNTLWVWEEML